LAGTGRRVGLAGSAAVTLIGAVTGGALSLANEALTARFLGLETYGFYAVAVALVKVGEIVAVFGAPLTVLRFLPVHLAQSQLRLAQGVILGGALAPLTIGLAFAVAVSFFSDFLANEVFHQPQTARWIGLLACAIPFLAMSDLIGNVARGFGYPLPYVAIRNVMPLLLAILFVSTLLLFRGPSVGVGYGYVLATATSCALGTIWTFNLIRERLGFVPPRLELATFYKCAFPLAINAIFTVVLLFSDVFVLAALTDSKTVGVYRGCVQLNVVYDLVINAFAAATAPILAVQSADNHQEELQRTLLSATRFAGFLLAPILCVQLSNAGDILRILGPGFEAGTLAFMTLGLCHFVKATASAASVMLVMSGKQTLEMTNTALATAANLTLNLALVPRFGLNGAAVATGASLLLLSLLRAGELRWLAHLQLVDTGFVRVALASAAAIGGSWVIAVALDFGPGGSFADLAARLMLAGLLVCGALWFVCLTRDERVTLKEFFLEHFASKLRPAPES
jgi:O-antigen/teichoic acid export membrane protein